MNNKKESPAQLYVVESTGKKHRLAAGEELEMRWLATELRAMLHVGNE